MVDRAGAPNTRPDLDNRDASGQMLAFYPAAFPDAKPTSATCRHFRNYVPREIADELRDNDPEPCLVCDAMPHRSKRRIQSVADYLPV
jgi:hypothetical protein